MKLPAGAWVDRWRKKRVVMAGDLIRGLLMLAAVGLIVLATLRHAERGFAIHAAHFVERARRSALWLAEDVLHRARTGQVQLRDGDLATYQSELEQAQALIERANELAAGTPPK